ncbi:MAG: permease-like cell division protein FtsX [Rikenellaceae bacterium]|nr:permease-like cell division protein FtsX [Rikenellaceae bacterium]
MKKREKNIVYRRLIQSYLSSVISISMVLLLAGLTGLMGVNAKSVSDYFRENIKLSVIFEEIAPDDATLRVFDQLKGKEYIKEMEYVSREKGTEEMKEILGEDFLELFEVNPIPVSIDIFLKSDYINTDSLSYVEQELSSMNMVKEVVYQESLVTIINDNMEKAGYVAGILMLLLVFISFVLINNTVRLNLYAKRFVIYTMKLVGARRSFIRRPLIIKGIWQGLVSGLISDILLGGLIYMLISDLPELFEILDKKMVFAVFAAVPVAGILLCVISTYFISNRLISMSGDDIYY